MPYIKKYNREKLKFITDVMGNLPEQLSPGDLNYLITIMCHSYLKRNGIKYSSYNDIIGALEGCKLEFYRRHVSEYEDQKIEENGDV